ncbi:hypothetical protein ACROYT_G006715 [Oculina patagonica]
MASAASTASSTKETTNYARLCRLLVDVGTQALRDTFDAIHAPANLHTVLAGNKTTLQSLRARKIINPTQWGKLFPAIPISVSTAHFDTTLLMVLLRNVCGLPSPATGWDTLPAVTDVSREADIARVKYFRNTVYGHAEQATVDDATFNTNWQDIRDTLVRLGGVQYRAAIDNLETECMDLEIEDHYRELLSQWKKDEDNVKDKLDEIGTGIEKVMKRLDDWEGNVSRSKEVTHGPVMCKAKYHENEAVEYYCQECEVCICQKCRSVLSHSRHSMVDIQHAAEEGKIEMKNDFERVKSKLVDVETMMKEQIELTEKSEEELSAAEKKATETVEEIIRVAREHETAVKSELAEMKKALQSDHETTMENFQLFAARLKNSVEYSKIIIERNIGPEILQEGRAVLGRCEKLLNSQEIKINKPKHVRYRTNKEFIDASRRFVPGHVVASDTDPSQSVAEGKGLKEAELDVETNFTITTRDTEGNQSYDEKDQVAVKICFSTGEDEGEIDDCKDGKYTVRYKPNNVAVHEIAVEVNGKPLTGSPWSVQVTPHQYKALHPIGSRGKGPEEFNGPHSIAVSQRTGSIAIADFNNKRIQLFDSDWKYLRTIGGGAGKIGFAMSVAFTASGDVIVMHEESSQPFKMSMFNERGQFIKHISQHLIDPLSVFVTTDGHMVVCDGGDKSVKVLSPDGKELLQSFSAPDCIHLPMFAVYHQDRFFVSYGLAHVVKVFNKEGVFLYDIGSKGSGDGQLYSPIGLTIDKFGNLIVCSSGNSRLQIFALDGKFINTINEGMSRPWSVAVDKDEKVLVCDYDNHCIHVFH